MQKSLIFLWFTISFGAIANPLPSENILNIDEHDALVAQRQDAVKKYIVAAHAFDARLRKEVALNAVAKRYVSFLAQFGAQEQGDILACMESLFAEDCKKVVNGRAVTRSRGELYAQMAKAKDALGMWWVKLVHPIAIDLETNTVVIHCEIPTQEAGTIVVMKFLTIDNGFITEINEVYNALDTVADSLHKITE